MGCRIMTWSTQVFPHTVVLPGLPWMKSIDFSISGWVASKLPFFVVDYLDTFYWPVRHMSTTNLEFWICQIFNDFLRGFSLGFFVKINSHYLFALISIENFKLIENFEKKSMQRSVNLIKKFWCLQISQKANEIFDRFLPLAS